jgi:hypothetical protein
MLLALLASFCIRYRGVDVRLYFLFSLTPVRGGGLLLLRFLAPAAFATAGYMCDFNFYFH